MFMSKNEAVSKYKLDFLSWSFQDKLNLNSPDYVLFIATTKWYDKV